MNNLLIFHCEMGVIFILNLKKSFISKTNFKNKKISLPTSHYNNLAKKTSKHKPIRKVMFRQADKLIIFISSQLVWLKLTTCLTKFRNRWQSLQSLSLINKVRIHIPLLCSMVLFQTVLRNILGSLLFSRMNKL